MSTDTPATKAPADTNWTWSEDLGVWLGWRPGDPKVYTCARLVTPFESADVAA